MRGIEVKNYLCISFIYNFHASLSLIFLYVAHLSIIFSCVCSSYSMSFSFFMSIFPLLLNLRLNSSFFLSVYLFCILSSCSCSSFSFCLSLFRRCLYFPFPFERKNRCSSFSLSLWIIIASSIFLLLSLSHFLSNCLIYSFPFLLYSCLLFQLSSLSTYLGFVLLLLDSLPCFITLSVHSITVCMERHN